MPDFEREPAMPMPNRTTARGMLVVAVVTATAVCGATARAGKTPPPPRVAKTAVPTVNGVPPLVFPVVGGATYVDDFGDPRAGGAHQGNDLMAPKRSIAIAVEAGTVKFWTTSAAAGCMLYLYGDSGTTYIYIHLNNDLTFANDNRGTCVAGTAYAPSLKNGARVTAGQPVGFVGDSGDADGIAAHLHFEVHPKGGAAMSPFPFLKRATQLLAPAPPAGTPFTLKLSGTVVSTAPGALDVKVQSLQSWPSHAKVTKLTKTISLGVPAEATVLPTSLDAAQPGQKVSVWTVPAQPTLAALTGRPGVLSAQKIELK